MNSLITFTNISIVVNITTMENEMKYAFATVGFPQLPSCSLHTGSCTMQARAVQENESPVANPRSVNIAVGTSLRRQKSHRLLVL